MQIKVSVVIPVYNAEKYIERSVRSLFGQTLDHIEYVFVDDCSPDGSISVIQKILEDYPERKELVKIIRNETNQGVGYSRNAGVKNTSGDYIIHCDADDWVDPDAYEQMYNKAVETNADMVCMPFVLEYADRAPSLPVQPYPAEDVATYVEKNSRTHLNSLWSKLYKREIAHQDLHVPDHICWGEDLLRNAQMLDKCRKISFVSGTCYHYWQSASSITHNFTEKHFQNLREITAFLDANFSGKFAIVSLQQKSTMLLRALLNMGRNPKLQPLFDEVWHALTPGEKRQIIFKGCRVLQGKLALTALYISKPLTIFLLKHLIK